VLPTANAVSRKAKRLMLITPPQYLKRSAAEKVRPSK
jgi:hypothetical protein